LIPAVTGDCEHGDEAIYGVRAVGVARAALATDGPGLSSVSTRLEHALQKRNLIFRKMHAGNG
jgi:hypothetical protein